MNSFTTISLILILLTQVHPSFHLDYDYDYENPGGSLSNDTSCQYFCGRGKCHNVTGLEDDYECVCQPGWQQSFFTNFTLGFRPCVIPSCTLNDCFSGALTDLAFEDPNGTFPSEPCSWAVCGRGLCIEDMKSLPYTCKCEEGYTNLLNNSSFPCFKNCSIDVHCRTPGTQDHSHSNHGLVAGMVVLAISIVSAAAVGVYKYWKSRRST